MVNIFSNGSCYNFHLILKCVYPESIPYYNIDHIITKIDNIFYDINGSIEDTNGYYPGPML